MKNKFLLYFAVIISLTLGCSSKPKCDFCRTFLLENKPFNYRYQPYGLERDVFQLPVDSNGMVKTHGIANIIDRDDLQKLKQSLFCFYKMPYKDLIHYIPEKKPVMFWGESGRSQTLNVILSVGDWNIDSYNHNKITLIGSDTIQFRFERTNKGLFFKGEKGDAEKYKSCHGM